MSKEVEDPNYRYGKWRGDPRGVRQYPERCVEECFSSSVHAGFVTHQCRRKRGHGTDGKYCYQHAQDTTNIRPRLNEKLLKEKL